MEPPAGDDWLALSDQVLPVGDAVAWATIPRCGGVVLFSGVVRDHAEDRRDVTALDYEAYDAQVLPRLRAIADDVRRRFPTVGRLAMLHRTGHLEVGETSVAVVASAPHRAEAFEAARLGIDALKATVPIWKRETWGERSDWGTGARPVSEVGG